MVLSEDDGEDEVANGDEGWNDFFRNEDKRGANDAEDSGTEFCDGGAGADFRFSRRARDEDIAEGEEESDSTSTPLRYSSHSASPSSSEKNFERDPGPESTIEEADKNIVEERVRGWHEAEAEAAATRRKQSEVKHSRGREQFDVETRLQRQQDREKKEAEQISG